MQNSVKCVLLGLVFLLTSFSGVRAIAAEPPSHEIAVAISEAFVPTSANKNTEAYAIISGMFPNSCYQWDRAEVVHIDQMTHEIRAIAKVTEMECLMVLVPYAHEVHLGKLVPGVHQLIFMSGDRTYFVRELLVH